MNKRDLCGKYRRTSKLFWTMSSAGKRPFEPRLFQGDRSRCFVSGAEGSMATVTNSSRHHLS